MWDIWGKIKLYKLSHAELIITYHLLILTLLSSPRGLSLCASLNSARFVSVLILATGVLDAPVMNSRHISNLQMKVQQILHKEIWWTCCWPGSSSWRPPSWKPENQMKDPLISEFNRWRTLSYFVGLIDRWRKTDDDQTFSHFVALLLDRLRSWRLPPPQQSRSSSPVTCENLMKRWALCSNKKLQWQWQH